MKWIKGLSLAALVALIPSTLSFQKIIEPSAVTPTQPPITLENRIALKDTKAAYASMWSMGHVAGAKRFIKLLKETTLNSLVIDGQSVHGYVAFKLPNNEHVQKYGLHDKRVDMDWPLKNIFANDIPVHFRFPVAKDIEFSKIEGGKYRVKSETGEKCEPFLDLNSEVVCKYKESIILDSIEEAIDLFVQLKEREPRKGEISVLLDYIRNPDQVDVPFPIFYWKEDEKIPGYQGAVNFVKSLREKLPPYVEVGLCVYGSTLHSNQENNNIGQNVPEMMVYADSLWPMSYPDHNSKHLRIWEDVKGHYAREVKQAKTLTDKPVIMWVQSYKGKKCFIKKLNERKMSQVAFVNEQIEGTESMDAGWAAWSSENKYVPLHAATYQIKPEVMAKIERESERIRLARVEPETNTVNAEISILEAHLIRKK